MKKLFSITMLAFAVIAFAPQVKAGYDGETASINTNNCPAASATFHYTKIPCGGQKDVAVHIEFNMSGASTVPQRFYFGRSVTGSTNDIETLDTKWTPVGIAATGTSRSVTITNLPSYGAGALYLIYSTNDVAAGGVFRTNTIVKYGEKTMAP